MPTMQPKPTQDSIIDYLLVDHPWFPVLKKEPPEANPEALFGSGGTTENRCQPTEYIN